MKAGTRLRAGKSPTAVPISPHGPQGQLCPLAAPPSPGTPAHRCRLFWAGDSWDPVGEGPSQPGSARPPKELPLRGPSCPLKTWDEDGDRLPGESRHPAGPAQGWALLEAPAGSAGAQPAGRAGPADPAGVMGAGGTGTTGARTQDGLQGLREACTSEQVDGPGRGHGNGGGGDEKPSSTRGTRGGRPGG